MNEFDRNINDMKISKSKEYIKGEVYCAKEINNTVDEIVTILSKSPDGQIIFYCKRFNGYEDTLSASADYFSERFPYHIKITHKELPKTPYVRLASSNTAEEPDIVIIGSLTQDTQLIKVRHLRSDTYEELTSTQIFNQYPYMHNKRVELVAGSYTFDELLFLLEKDVRNNILTLPQLLMSIEMMARNSRGFKLYREGSFKQLSVEEDSENLTDDIIFTIATKVFVKLIKELIPAGTSQEIVLKECIELNNLFVNISVGSESNYNAQTRILIQNTLTKYHAEILDILHYVVISGKLKYDFTYKLESYESSSNVSTEIKKKTSMFQ